MTRKSKYMAFWKYDLFPYLLWGEVDDKIPDKLWKGKIAYYIPSYQGHFVPQFILPIKEGVELGKQIDELKRLKKIEDRYVYDKYMKKLKQTLLESGVEQND